MKIAITGTEPSLDARVDPRFGRCACFLIVDTETMDSEPLANPNVAVGSGAGIQSAQLMADRGVECLLTGNCGPNAYQTLSAAGIRVILGCSGSIRDVVEQFRANAFEQAAQPNVPSHFGVTTAPGQGAAPDGSMPAPPQGFPAPGPGMGGGGGGGGGGRGMGGGGRGRGGGGRGMGGGGGGRGMGGGGGGRGMGGGGGGGGGGRGR